MLNACSHWIVTLWGLEIVFSCFPTVPRAYSHPSAVFYKIAKRMRCYSRRPPARWCCAQVPEFPLHHGAHLIILHGFLLCVLWTLTSDKDLCCGNYYKDLLLFLIKHINCIPESIMEIEKYKLLFSSPLLGLYRELDFLLWSPAREHFLLKGGRFT